jgi:hypothetical protein
MSLAEFGDIADQQLAKGKTSLSGITKSGRPYLKPPADNEASEGSGSEEIVGDFNGSVVYFNVGIGLTFLGR